MKFREPGVARRRPAQRGPRGGISPVPPPRGPPLLYHFFARDFVSAHIAATYSLLVATSERLAASPDASPRAARRFPRTPHAGRSPGRTPGPFPGDLPASFLPIPSRSGPLFRPGVQPAARADTALDRNLRLAGIKAAIGAPEPRDEHPRSQLVLRLWRSVDIVDHGTPRCGDRLDGSSSTVYRSRGYRRAAHSVKLVPSSSSTVSCR